MYATGTSTMNHFEQTIFYVLLDQFIKEGRSNILDEGECKRLANRILLDDSNRNVLFNPDRFLGSSGLNEQQLKLVNAACLSVWLDCNWVLIALELNRQLKLD